MRGVSMRLVPAAGAAVVLLVASVAEAATITVRPGGPVATIGDALAMAQDGDTIVLSRGVYTESVTVPQSRLTIVGRGAVWEGVTPGGPVTCLTIEGDGVTVRGVTFRHGGNLVLVSGADVSLVSCRFRHAAADAVRVTGARATIDRCRADACEGAAVLFDPGGDDGQVLRLQVRNSGGPGVRGAGVPRLLVDRSDFAFLARDGVAFEGCADGSVTRTRIRTVDGRGVVVAASSGGSVEACEIRNTRGSGVSFEGMKDSSAVRNRITGTRGGFLVSAEGDGITVADNRLQDASSDGIVVVGDDAAVRGNSVSGCGDSGIRVEGDRASVTDDRISDVLGAGIFVSGGAADVRRNHVDGALSGGIGLDGSLGTVEDCEIADCGATPGLAGVALTGNDFRVSGVTVRDGSGRGFFVFGARNVFADCTARSLAGDGFRIAFGASNAVERGLAVDCGGQGLVNSGTGTSVTDTTLVDCRILLANTGTFATFTGNNVEAADAVKPQTN